MQSNQVIGRLRESRTKKNQGTEKDQGTEDVSKACQRNPDWLLPFRSEAILNWAANCFRNFSMRTLRWPKSFPKTGSSPIKEAAADGLFADMGAPDFIGTENFATGKRTKGDLRNRAMDVKLSLIIFPLSLIRSPTNMLCPLVSP